MTTYNEIPFQPNAPQRLQVALDGVTYTLVMQWNRQLNGGTWVLDVYDITGTTLLVGGIAIVTGADLFEQFPDKAFGGALVAITDNSPWTPPTFTNLGVSGRVYYVTNP